MDHYLAAVAFIPMSAVSSGTTSSGVFTPTSAYAFNQHDEGPVGDNED